MVALACKSLFRCPAIASRMGLQMCLAMEHRALECNRMWEIALVPPFRFRFKESFGSACHSDSEHAGGCCFELGQVQDPPELHQGTDDVCHSAVSASSTPYMLLVLAGSQEIRMDAAKTSGTGRSGARNVLRVRRRATADRSFPGALRLSL